MVARETNPNFMNGVPELLILKLLQQDEMYGYEIVQAIRDRTGAVIAIGEGVVYPVLHGLERDGAVRARRGKAEDLAQALIERSRFRSWCARAPWAMFGFGPLILLGAAYLVACLYLWCGWNFFLPGTDTPFGPPVAPTYSFANIYFQ